MSQVNVAVATFSASAVVGLLVAPTHRHVAWAGRICAAAVLTSLTLALVSVALMAAGEWEAPVWTLSLASVALLPAWWLGRAPDGPGGAAEGDAEGDDESGGGGGGLRKPPEEPPPAPPTPGLDWDAFDDARESWAAREREPALR